MRIVVFAAVALLGLARTGEAAETGAPDAADVIGLMIRNHAIELGAEPSCHSAFVIAAGERTLGAYLAQVLGVIATPGDNRIILACTPAAPGWRCDLSVQHNQPANDVFWRYGLRLAIDDKGSLVPGSLSCIGGG